MEMQKLVILCLLSFACLGNVFASFDSPLSPYSTDYFDYASRFVSDGDTECAKFVNRNFYARFGEFIWGSAWNFYDAAVERNLLTFKWRVNDDDVDSETLMLKEGRFREAHYSQLYQVLDSIKDPIGVVGFFYRFSFWKEALFASPYMLPQTHVAMLVGRKVFVEENETEQDVTLRDIWEEKYGVIHEYEEAFLNSRLMQANMFSRTTLSLDTKIEPGEKIAYRDYQIEEQFRTARRHSLLEMYLKKHRNNHVMSLLRPVSFLQVTDELMDKVEGNNSQSSN